MYAVSHLKNLQILRASNNLLDDQDHVTSIVSDLEHLTELDLRHNPIAAFRKYRISIIQNSKSLMILDDREIGTEKKNSLVKLAERIKSQRKRDLKSVPKRPRNKDDSEENRKPHLIFYGKVIKETSVERKYILGALRNSDFDAFLLAKQAMLHSNINDKDKSPQSNNQFVNNDSRKPDDKSDFTDEETQPAGDDNNEPITDDTEIKEINNKEITNEKGTTNLSTSAVSDELSIK